MALKDFKLSDLKKLKGKKPEDLKGMVGKEVKKAAVGAAVGLAFGLAFKLARQRLHMTQQQAADATFTSRRSVVGWEHGRAPKVATQAGLLALLGAAKAVDKVRGR